MSHFAIPFSGHVWILKWLSASNAYPVTPWGWNLWKSILRIFELDAIEQTEVILNILMYAGVIIRDPQIVQTAASMVQQDEVNQKS